MCSMNKSTAQQKPLDKSNSEKNKTKKCNQNREYFQNFIHLTGKVLPTCIKNHLFGVWSVWVDPTRMFYWDYFYFILNCNLECIILFSLFFFFFVVFNRVFGLLIFYLFINKADAITFWSYVFRFWSNLERGRQKKYFFLLITMVLKFECERWLNCFFTPAQLFCNH